MSQQTPEQKILFLHLFLVADISNLNLPSSCFIMYYILHLKWSFHKSDWFWKQHDWVSSSSHRCISRGHVWCQSESHCHTIRLYCFLHVPFSIAERLYFKVEIRKQCVYLTHLWRQQVAELNPDMLLRSKPKKADGLISMPVFAQFGPGVETRLPTCSGQILNMFPGPELL